MSFLAFRSGRPLDRLLSPDAAPGLSPAAVLGFKLSTVNCKLPI